MRFPLRRLACALALALSAPAGAGGTEHVADGWAEAQARLARVLSIVEPAAAEKPPAAPKTQVLTAPGVSAANEGGVVDTLAAGIAPERKPPATMVCMQGAPDGPLDLALVAGQVLCNHPKTAAAWAKARAEAARVELARAAWQPNAQANVAYSHSSSSYSKPIKDEVTARTLNLELKLSWLFYDFGTRRANFDSAVAVLDAAHATRNATVQQVLFEASQAWFEVRAAQAQLIAAREAVRAARDSLATAQARFDAGAAARLDVLQAANAHAQARLKQAQAESAQRNALGALAVKMGLPAETPLSLVPAEGAPARWEAPGSVASLIAEASLHHPSLRAARHELDALAARVGVARAEGLPSLFGTAGYQRNRDFETTPLYRIDSTHSFGLQLSVPLFEAQARKAKVGAAQAEFEARQAELASLEQQVGFEVWKAYNELGSERERLAVGDELLANARRAQDIAQGRYKAGVGDILEALNAQTVLADATRQQIEARAAWQIARLKLAAAMGRIGPWAIE